MRFMSASTEWIARIGDRTAVSNRPTWPPSTCWVSLPMAVCPAFFKWAPALRSSSPMVSTFLIDAWMSCIESKVLSSIDFSMVWTPRVEIAVSKAVIPNRLTSSKVFFVQEMILSFTAVSWLRACSNFSCTAWSASSTWSFIDACSGTWVWSNCFLISCNSASTELYCCSILSTHSISHKNSSASSPFPFSLIKQSICWTASWSFKKSIYKLPPTSYPEISCGFVVIMRYSSVSFGKRSTKGRITLP